MCKKNKINVIRAVCNNAARKLTVLSLAVAVSGGAVANANPPKRKTVVLSFAAQGREVLEQRLRDLEKDRSNKIKQEGDIKRQIIETKQRKKNIQYLLTPPCPKDVVGVEPHDNSAWLQEYRDALVSLENDLLSLNEALENQILTIASLDVQIEDLRAQIEVERQEAPAEEIVEIVPGEEIKEEPDEPQRRNRTPEGQSVRLQNGTVFALGETAQDTLKNLIRAMKPQMLARTMKEPLGQK